MAMYRTVRNIEEVTYLTDGYLFKSKFVSFCNKFIVFKI